MEKYKNNNNSENRLVTTNKRVILVVVAVNRNALDCQQPFINARWFFLLTS